MTLSFGPVCPSLSAAKSALVAKSCQGIVGIAAMNAAAFSSPHAFANSLKMLRRIVSVIATTSLLLWFGVGGKLSPLPSDDPQRNTLREQSATKITRSVSVGGARAKSISSIEAVS